MRQRPTFCILALLATSALATAQREEIARIEPLSPPGTGGGGFGQTLVAEANRLLIGNPFRSPTASIDRAFELLERVPDGWMHTPSPPMPPGEVLTDVLGYSLDLSGDTIVAGSLLGSYVWIVDTLGSGQWSAGTRLDPPTSEPGFFGRALSLEGDVLAVAAPTIDGAQHTNEGRVYIYERSGSGAGWALVQTLAPPPAFVHLTNYQFGFRVDIEGDRMAIVGGWSRGRYAGVFVYERRSTGWDLVQVIGDPDPIVAQSHLNAFAYSISLGSNVLVVGREGDSTTFAVRGEALVYEPDAAGVWQLSATLRPSFQINNDRFGATVAVHDNIIVVGASEGFGGPSGRAGQAYVFRRRPNGTWPATEDERLVPSDDLGTGFGSTVAAGPGFALVYDENRWEQTTFVYGVGQEDDVCLPSPGSGATTCHLDTFGSSSAGSGLQGLTLSYCAPSTRYVVVGSLTPDVGGTGPIIGGMQLCLTGSLARVAFGQVDANTTLEFVEPGTWAPSAAALFGVAQTVYLQGFVAEPGGVIGFTNAIRWDLD